MKKILAVVLLVGSFSVFANSYCFDKGANSLAYFQDDLLICNTDLRLESLEKLQNSLRSSRIGYLSRTMKKVREFKSEFYGLRYSKLLDAETKECVNALNKKFDKLLLNVYTSINECM